MRDPYWMTLRRFAEDAGAGEGGGQPENGGQQPGTKTQTFDDVLKANPAFQAEFDRRMSKGLETAKSKWETDAQARMEAAKTEAEKLAKMTAEQKAEHERQKREEDLQKRERELNRRELRAEAAETLAQKGLPAGLLDTLNYGSAEACQQSITAVENAFRAAVQAGVEARLKGTAPAGSGGKGAEPDWNNMSDEEYYKATMKKRGG